MDDTSIEKMPLDLAIPNRDNTQPMTVFKKLFNSPTHETPPAPLSTNIFEVENFVPKNISVDMTADSRPFSAKSRPFSTSSEQFSAKSEADNFRDQSTPMAIDLLGNNMISSTISLPDLESESENQAVQDSTTSVVQE